MATSYLLDTSVLLHLTRDSRQGKEIERQFDLANSRLRPLVCEVSWGELRAFAKGRGWQSEKLQRLEKLKRSVVVVDISDDRVVEEYANLQTAAFKNGWGIFNAKNAIWIGAAARAAGAHLLTTDSDFRPIRDVLGWAITILDPNTGSPIAG